MDALATGDGFRPEAMQDALFDGSFTPLPEDLGFRGPVACGAAGITYRQLDYWAAPAWSSPRSAAPRVPARSVCTPSVTC